MSASDRMATQCAECWREVEVRKTDDHARIVGVVGTFRKNPLNESLSSAAGARIFDSVSFALS